MDQNQIAAVGGTRITIASGAVVRVAPSPYTFGQNLKILSGGGTLEILGPSMALGTGYPVGASETVSVSGPAVFYLGATGATMVAAVTVGYTNGATLP